MLLIGRTLWEICFNQSEALLDGDASSVLNFCALISLDRETSGGIVKCHLFCQANHLFIYLFFKCLDFHSKRPLLVLLKRQMI